MDLIVALAALALGAGLAAAGARRAASAPAPARRQPRAVLAPEQFVRLQRAVRGGASTAGDLQTSLRPVLRIIAAERLRRRGVELDAQPEEARELLGEALWQLMRPDLPRPGDAFAPGASLRGVADMIDRLERL